MNLDETLNSLVAQLEENNKRIAELKGLGKMLKARIRKAERLIEKSKELQG